MKLPKQLEQTNTLEHLAAGQTGYTVPGAMWVDPNRDCWLHPRYTFHEEPTGTVQMAVTRLPSGYCVDVSRCADHRWKPTPHPTYIGDDDVDWLLVTEIWGAP